MIDTLDSPHFSVLLDEVLNLFQSLSIRSFLDGTLGAGGHAYGILDSHQELREYVGIDQDPLALNLSEKRLITFKNKLLLKRCNFSEFDRLTLPIAQFDGILVDLGVSSMQLDTAERGFSFTKEVPLDMRMKPNAELTAKEIVNTWSEGALGEIFRGYGEEKRWRQASKIIVQARLSKTIETTSDLSNILKPIFPWNPKKRINPLTLIFQALRIAVNEELKRLADFLPKAVHALNPGGRLAIISFHSLEDRIVKQQFNHLASDKWNTSGIGGVFQNKDPTVRIITKKPIVPGEKEILENPRSRSAKLRAIEKI